MGIKWKIVVGIAQKIPLKNLEHFIPVIQIIAGKRDKRIIQHIINIAPAIRNQWNSMIRGRKLTDRKEKAEKPTERDIFI